MSYTSLGTSIPVTGPNLGFPGTVSRPGATIAARQVLPTTPNNVLFGAAVVLVPESIGGTSGLGGFWQSILDYLTAPAVIVSATTVNTSPITTVASAAGLVVGMAASGTGIGSNAVITAIVGLAVTLSANSTASGTVNVTFAIPTGNSQYLAQNYAGFAVRQVKQQLTYPTGTPGGIVQVGYYAPSETAEVMEEGSMTINLAYGTPTANSPVYLRVVANSGITGTAVGDIEAASDVAATTTFGSTQGSAVITVASATGIAVGQVATGAGIPTNATVLSISGTSITLSANAMTTVASGIAVSFANTLALPDTVFRTGFVDSTGIAEVTILHRRAA